VERGPHEYRKPERYREKEPVGNWGIAEPCGDGPDGAACTGEVGKGGALHK